MLRQIRQLILGNKLSNAQLSGEKFNIFWGLPILASDAISSVAYAIDEILWVLIPVAGAASYIWLPRIAGTIILLLVILTFSYRQTVTAYPNGGGSYMVAKENLGLFPGLVAGASLSVDYVLTVAVSISAAASAIISAIPAVQHHRILIALIFILLLVIGNLRGIRESARIFSFPTYAFLLGFLVLIGFGLLRYFSGAAQPIEHPTTTAAGSAVTFGTAAVTLVLLLKAFSSGCSALTGVEAIANAVPNFRAPEIRNARISYSLLSISVLVTFGGSALLGMLYQAVPSSEQTSIAQITRAVFGTGVMFYFIQATTAIILGLAANTAFAGFPTLLSVLGQDRFAPRQMAMRGHRLNYNNGIVTLALLASLLVIIFRGDPHLLIPLYSIGVFTSFTLSQAGMFLHWWRSRPEGWRHRAFINGLGAVVTLVAVVVIGMEKFTQGAWIVFVVVPVMVTGMYWIYHHYRSLAQHLDVPNADLEHLEFDVNYEHYVIIPIDSFNRMVLRTLRYARSMSPHVIAFHVEVLPGEADKLRQKWSLFKTDIPLVIKSSPYREVIGPLRDYINSAELHARKGDLITVLLPQFVVKHWWEAALHNNTSLFIANGLFHQHNVVISVLPFNIEDLEEDWSDLETRRKKRRQYRQGPIVEI
ncbi:MAG: amino acid permease [Methylocystaceae bacterium]